MNKKELIISVAGKTKISQKDTAQILEMIFEEITQALEKGEKVQLAGIGTFETRLRAARKGVNPRTGEKIELKASTGIAFKAGKALKDRVNK